MSTPTPYQESPPRTLPVPTPTKPVAGRPAASEAPTFDWTPVPDATKYRVQIAETEAFETIYYDEPTARAPSLSLDSVLPDDTTTACWRVRAETGESTTSPWSDAAHFLVPTAELAADDEVIRVDAPPVPVHPHSRRDAPVDHRAVTFSWEEIPAASGYHLQVARSEVIADPSVDLTVDQTTSVTLYDVVSPEASPLHWRVRALYRTAAPGPWSSVVSFTVAPPSDEDEDIAPETVDPESSARAAGPVEHARTSRGFSLFVSLFAVLSFIATIALIFLVT